jgi:transposase
MLLKRGSEMGVHADDMERLRMTRSRYLSAIRKQQPLEELERKALKARRIKQKIWTQEDIDYGSTHASFIVTNLIVV